MLRIFTLLFCLLPSIVFGATYTSDRFVGNWYSGVHGKFTNFSSSFITGTNINAQTATVSGVLTANDIIANGEHIVARKYSTLADADAAAVSAGKALVISTQWNTVPSSFSSIVIFFPGGKINNSGAVTFSDYVFPTPGCFIGSGAVNITKGDINPSYWGALGDGSADDTAAILKAFTAGSGKTVNFDPGRTFIVDGSLLTLTSGTTYDGHGSTLKAKAGTYTSSYFFLGSNTAISNNNSIPFVNNVGIKNFVIDGNKANITMVGSYSGTGISLYRMNNVVVDNVDIRDLAGITGTGYGIIAANSVDVVANKVKINWSDRSNIYVWETKNFQLSNSILLGSYYRDCITAGSNTPYTYQASSFLLSNVYMKNINPTGTHVFRLTGDVKVSGSNVDLYGYLADSGGGTGATATATISGGAVTSITVTNGGSGYTSPPEIQIFGGGGEIATATATINGSGEVDAINVTYGGTGYTGAPTVRVGLGTEGVYMVGTLAKELKLTNLNIDNSYYGIYLESDAENLVEVTNFNITAKKGINVIANDTSVRFINGKVTSTERTLYINYAASAYVSGVDLIGGTLASTFTPTAGGSYVLLGNTIRDNTYASYSLLVGAAGGVIIGNSLIDNTNNLIHCLGDVVGIGNTAITSSGVIRNGHNARKSTTANRPTLTANDVGFMYLDTTLDAAGRPIFWTGTTWVENIYSGVSETSTEINLSSGGSKDVRLTGGTSTGNTIVGTQADNGSKFQVTGAISASTSITGASLIQTSGGSSGKVICWKTATTLGYCSDAPNGTGDCTCN